MTIRLIEPSSAVLHRQWVTGLTCFTSDLTLHCIARTGAVKLISGVPNESALLPDFDHPGRGFAVSLVAAPRRSIHLLLVNAGLTDHAYVDAWIINSGLFFYAIHQGDDQTGFMPMSAKTGHEILTAVKSFAAAHPGFLGPQAV